MREYHHELYDLFSESGFDPLDAIAKYDGTKASADKFVTDYGSKWQSLIASFERFKRISAMERGTAVTARDYDRSVRALFGRED
jgi:hypothetical protein